MEIGFTGTRNGMTGAQSQRFYVWLNNVKWKEVILHHGCCIGADEDAHNLFQQLLEHRKDRSGYTSQHPPLNRIAISLNLPFRNGDTTFPSKPYLQRNHDIVDACGILIATPGQVNEVLRSGTWATIRYAKKQGKPVRIIQPDGTIVH